MLCLVACAATAGSLRAQAPDSAHARVGFIGGITFNRVNGALAHGAGTRLGAVFGVAYVSRQSLGHYGYEIDAQYALKGGTVSSGRNRLVLQMNYLELPVLFRHDFVSGRFHRHVVLGPVAAVRVGCNARGLLDDFRFEFPCPQIPGVLGDPSRSDISHFDVGMVAGVGIDAPIGVRRFSYTLRVTQGVRSVSRGQSLYTRSLAVAVRYSFFSKYR
jgi:hypothetical protein